jgi:hypothetical protein
MKSKRISVPARPSSKTLCKYKLILISETMYPAFSWVLNGASKLPNDCHSYNDEKGDCWAKVTDNYAAAVCVNKKDNTTPFWIEFKPHHEGDTARRVDFKHFLPQVPGNNTFAVPSNC